MTPFDQFPRHAIFSNAKFNQTMLIESHQYFIIILSVVLIKIPQRHGSLMAADSHISIKNRSGQKEKRKCDVDEKQIKIICFRCEPS